MLIGSFGYWFGFFALNDGWIEYEIRCGESLVARGITYPEDDLWSIFDDIVGANAEMEGKS